MTNNLIRPGYFCATLLIASCGFAAEHFFTPPESLFIIEPKEKVIALELASGTAENAQKQVDASRPAQSNVVLVVRLSGKIVVGKVPLHLGSRTCLVLNEGASIEASAESTAGSLLEIDGAEFVSISSDGPGLGVLDGQGRSLVGITVKSSGKVNLDSLSIRGCGMAAVAYAGREAVLVNDGASLTRCLIRDCGEGLAVKHAAAFICLDNEFRNNRGAAVTMASQRSIIAGNDFIGNKTGVVSASERGVIARNVFAGGENSMKLDAASVANLITENRSRGKTGVFIIGGSDNQIFGNELQASAQMAQSGKNNLLVNNAGLQIKGGVAAMDFFNPPTFNNPHSNNVIVSGMGRFDLTILGSTNRYEPMDLVAAQEVLQKARTEQSNAVVVARLQGYFISRTPTGLELAENMCVILDGSIRADFGGEVDPAYKKGEAITQVVRLSPRGYSSFSGGAIDGGRQASHGISATNKSIALVDGVSIKGATRDGIRTKGRGDSAPLFINGCTISACGGRGIWLHVAGNIHAVGNTCVGNQQDGIDVDAHATDCNVLFNVCNGNRRHGIFLEEAVNNNLVFGNQLVGNTRSGVHVWNEEVAGNTGQNVIAANVCSRNVKGVSAGGRAADRTAGGSFFFNNACIGNRDFNVVSGNSHATNNFFSQMVIRGREEKTVGVFNNADGFLSEPLFK